MAELAEAPKKTGMYRRDHLLEVEEEARKVWDAHHPYEANAPADGKKKKETFFVTFPYPYMNGRLHLGHAYSLTKCEFAARFQRLNGKDVLFPFGFHCTGMPICAAANKVKKELAAERDGTVADHLKIKEKKETAEEDKVGVFKSKKSKAVAKAGGLTQCEVLMQMGIEKELIPNFEDPNYWLTYFPPYAQLDLARFGLSCDWRRSFITTEVNPYYDKFIRWQFQKLREADVIKFGKRECIYSIEQGQACADHDRASGEGTGPQEYTLIKLKIAQIKPEWEDALGDADVFLTAATLRPETMYGQTNCFVLMEGDYGFYLMNNDEVFVTTHRAAINMFYQDMGDLDGAKEPEPLLTVKGTDLVGLPLNAPLAPYDVVYVLPMFTISMKKGTGIVTSVPADSPDDFACLNDWKTKEGMRNKFGVKEEWCNFEPVPVVTIPDSEYGTMAAPYLCAKLKIESHKDKDKLALAKKEVYLKGFYQGILSTGPYKGQTVQKGKLLVREEMIKNGQAAKYFEPENEIISRNGDECIVAKVDQWYLTYNDEAWTEKVMNHVDSDFEVYNKSAHNALKHTIGWMGQWACSRQFGLGTRLPWDEKWLIESLSDSTIYMAYYTFAHLLQGGRLNGDVPGPYGIAAEDLTNDDFDYILDQTNTLPKNSKLPVKALKEMRTEFQHWYPMNLRCSGKDLIQNHLTMSLFNHAAVWKDPKYWPKGFYTNGHVSVDAQKMSKSVGNFLTLKQAIDQFGADATRLACADAGDTLEDANFSRETANQAILRLTTFETFATDTMQLIKDKKLRTGEHNFLDTVFLNGMSKLVNDCHDGFTTMIYRKALQACWFEFQTARDEYRDLLGASGKDPSNLHADLIYRWMEVQCIILSPVCPHMCEHIWSNIMGKKTTLAHESWPVMPAEDKMVSRKWFALRAALRTFRLDKDKCLKGKKPQPCEKAVIEVAKSYLPWQQTVLKVLLSVELDAENKPVDPELMRSLNTLPEIQAIPKAESKLAMGFANYMMKNDVEHRGKDALELELPYDELAMLEERRDVIERQLNCKGDNLTFRWAGEPEKGQKKIATPGNPVIFFS